jgi:Cu2+-exporting ATPase
LSPRTCLTPVAIAVDGQLECVLGVGDPIRSEASGLVRQLTARGWRVWLLSGDDPATVGRAAATIGIPPARPLGGRSPEQKLELVRQLERKPVIMVGDGLNDLAAMAGADVGVAVQQGAHATLDLADVTLTGSGLRQLVALGGWGACP